MSQSKRFWNKITIISFACSLMVIYTHAFNLETYGIKDGLIYNIEIITNTFNTNAVPFFFAISGLLFFRNFQMNDIRIKYKKRVKTILIPYIIWCIIYYLFNVVVTNANIFFNIANVKPVELSISELINWLWNTEYYTLWFLKNLIIFIALSPIEYFVLKNRKKIPMGIFSFVVAFFIIDAINVRILDGFIFYLFGAYIGINHMNSTEYKNKTFSFISVMIAIVAGIITIVRGGAISRILLIVFAWYALDLFNIEEMKIPLWMKNTFFFYLCHDLILEPLERMFFLLFGKQPQILAIIDYIFMPIITILIMLLIAKLATKYIPKIWNVVIGGRQENIVN